MSLFNVFTRTVRKFKLLYKIGQEEEEMNRGACIIFPGTGKKKSVEVPNLAVLIGNKR